MLLFVYHVLTFVAVVYLWFAYDKLETKLDKSEAAVSLLKQELDALKSRDQPSR
jgi:hypothetical protein